MNSDAQVLEISANTLGTSVPAAERWWAFSRAWLFEKIESEQEGSDAGQELCITIP